MERGQKTENTRTFFNAMLRLFLHKSKGGKFVGFAALNDFLCHLTIKYILNTSIKRPLLLFSYLIKRISRHAFKALLLKN